jgi:hypothetical protein
MPACPDRERFTIKYHDAVVIFSASVHRLRECNGDGNGFAAAQRQTELARLNAENARMTLEIHRAEHNC